MKKILLQSALISLFSLEVFAKDLPNITGNVLVQMQADRASSEDEVKMKANNAFGYVEANMSLNFNKNWSLNTNWRLQPNNIYTTRDSVNPERYRTFMADNRGMPQDMGLLVEELKLQFKNEDLMFSIGKFDPTFGTAYKKNKRIGIFTSQFAEDYNLREKMGVSFSALLEDSKITVNSFFNDTTALSSSAFNDRGRAPRSDGIAGNNGTLSSYSAMMEGQNFFGIKDWFYNIGYRSLATDNIEGRKREKGYVIGSEYSIPVGAHSFIIPFAEIVKINNFTGEANRDALYSTFALIGKYSSWTASISHLDRHISQRQRSSNINDRQLQLSLGYKFTNNISLDVTRSRIRENGNRGQLYGANLLYVYNF